MMAAQLKHPSLAGLFIDSLERQGFPESSPNRVMVCGALRVAASRWQINLEEAETFERRGGGSLPREALNEASERRATVLAGRPEVCGVDVCIQCYPHDVVIARIAVLGMSAAAKVMLTPAESFQLLAQASTLVSLTDAHDDWTSDTAAQVAFLSMSAYHEWCHDNGRERSPKSAVSVGKWESVLAEMTGVSLAKIRICKVRIVNAMKPVKPEE